MESYIARQPIFDLNQNVYAYELLFRSSLENYFDHADVDQAASQTIVSGFMLHEIQKLTGGKKAFINVTRDVLLKDYMTLLPKDLTVVELLETIDPDEEVLMACQRLKRAGYLLALDDFVYDEDKQDHVKLADIIKVDFLATKGEERRALVERFSSMGIRFLAEKVETIEDFKEAVDMGYSYFQGYFFSKPVVLAKKDVPGFKLHYFRILQEIRRPELDFDKVEGIVKVDMSLCYKLLRYVNSPFFGLRNPISSIKQALVLLGEKEVKKWVSLLTLANMGEDKPEELVVLAVTRAKFCESLAPLVGMKARESDFFLMGMFSLIDTILDQPLEAILEEVAILPDVKSALLGEKGTFRDVFEFVLSYEKGDWENNSVLGSKLKLQDHDILALYMNSIEWAQHNFKQK